MFQPLSQIKISGKSSLISPFSLSSSKCGFLYLLVMPDSVEVFELKFRIKNHLKGITFLKEKILCPQRFPTKDLKYTMDKVFVSASMDDKLRVFNEPIIYAKNLKQEQIAQIIKAEFSETINKRQFLAVLSHSGALTVFRKVGKEWKPFINVEEKLFNLSAEKKSPMKTFKEFQTKLEEIFISSFCWTTSGKEHQLIVCTRDGSIIISTINEEETSLNIIFKEPKHLERNPSNLLSIKSKDDFFLLEITTKKDISLHSQSDLMKGKTEALKLWQEQDEIPIFGLESKLLENGNVIIALAKSNHLIQFLISPKGKVLKQDVQTISFSTIVGILFTNANELIVSTSDHQHFKLNYNEDLKMVNKNPISHQFDSHFGCHGSAKSLNNLLWMFCNCAILPFDPIKLNMSTKYHNSVIHITIATMSNAEPTFLLLENPQLSLTNYHDCLELIRFWHFKKPIAKEFSEMLMEQISKFSDLDELSYKLQLQLTCLYCLESESWANSDHEIEEQLKAEQKLVRLLIQSISFNKLLNKILKEGKKDWTPLKQQSVLKMKSSLMAVQNAEKRDDYKEVINKIEPLFKQTIEKINKITFKVEPEKCNICDKDIQNDNLNCYDNHNVPRCCFTNLQVSLVQEEGCPICSLKSLEHKTVKEILDIEIGKYECPLCNVDFE